MSLLTAYFLGLGMYIMLVSSLGINMVKNKELYDYFLSRDYEHRSLLKKAYSVFSLIAYPIMLPINLGIKTIKLILNPPSHLRNQNEKL